MSKAITEFSSSDPDVCQGSNFSVSKYYDVDGSHQLKECQSGESRTWF